MLLQSIQSNFSVFTQTSVTPVTQDHVYSTNATQDHEISYYIMHYHAICQGNLTQCTVVQWMPFFFKICWDWPFWNGPFSFRLFFNPIRREDKEKKILTFPMYMVVWCPFFLPQELFVASSLSLCENVFSRFVENRCQIWKQKGSWIQTQGRDPDPHLVYLLELTSTKSLTGQTL